MKKVIQYLVTTLTIIGGIIAIISFIYQVKSNKPKMEILEISNDNLTNLPEVKNLKSNFYYKDSLITNLWKINVRISNNGAQTIVGKGSNKNLINDHLVFSLNDGYKLIDFNISDSSFPYSIENSSNEVRFYFNQWRVDERVSIVAYAEQIIENESPLAVLLNERDILDGEVTYRKANQEPNKSKRLIDFLPSPLVRVLYWFGLIFYGIFLVFLPIGAGIEINKYLAYKKWNKKWLSVFYDQINDLIKDGDFYTPETLPEYHWNEIGVPRPDIPDTNIVVMMLGIILGLCILIIPYLWMVTI